LPAPRRAASPGRWLELAVEADIEAVEAVSEILSRVAPGGVSVEAGYELVDEGLGARVDPTKPVVIRAYVPARDPAEAERAVAQADAALGHLQAFGLRTIGALQTRFVDEADWAAAWKDHFPVLRVGRRLVIRPSWRRHRRIADEVVLDLDPGMAFGTGLHPTTRLCLAALESLADASDGLGDAPEFAGSRGLDGARVLDVGCGSGILSIAAARLGARAVVAIDVDPIAVEATRANARRNRLAGQIDTRQGSLPSGAGPFDLVLANLIASLLVQLAASLAEELRPGGTLLASGIFIDRESAVVEAFEAAGLACVARSQEVDWVALEAVRRP
jgi:ribosomal protein L11 methyltransferase